MDLLHIVFQSMSNIGFLTAWTAMLLGILINFFTANAGKRFKGTMLGFIGGLLLSVVCFDLIPDAFQSGSIGLGILSMLLGLSFSTVLDGLLNAQINESGRHLYKAAIFMTIGVALDNFPSGIALGSIFTISTMKGIQLAFILFLHSIPEGLTIGYFLKESNKGLFSALLLTMIGSVPMGLGAGIGAAVSKVSPQILSVSLAFASGLILYVVFRETLAESRNTWSGRLSAIGNVLGLILGFFAVRLIH